jgi:hypothetical protein
MTHSKHSLASATAQVSGPHCMDLSTKLIHCPCDIMLVFSSTSYPNESRIIEREFAMAWPEKSKSITSTTFHLLEELFM